MKDHAVVLLAACDYLIYAESAARCFGAGMHAMRAGLRFAGMTLIGSAYRIRVFPG
jgi:hypothetical protein